MATPDQILTIYRTFRDYIEHEDKLISERISRTLLVHGFLLASYVLLLQSRIGVAARCLGRDKGCIAKAIAKNTDPNLVAPDQLSAVLLLADLMLPVIAMIGVLTTLAALRGVWAANQAIRSLWERWNDKFAKRSDISDLELPDVTRGGSGISAKSRRLLHHLMFMWGCILAFSIVLATTWNSPTRSKWLSDFMDFIGR